MRQREALTESDHVNYQLVNKQTTVSYKQQKDAIDIFTIVPLGTGNTVTPSSPNGFGTCSTVSSNASLTNWYAAANSGKCE